MDFGETLRSKKWRFSMMFQECFRRVEGMLTVDEYFFRLSSGRQEENIASLGLVAAERSKPFPKKQTIFAQGDSSDAVFYIREGKVTSRLWGRSARNPP
jgi:hypothetical protein